MKTSVLHMNKFHKYWIRTSTSNRDGQGFFFLGNKHFTVGIALRLSWLDLRLDREPEADLLSKCDF